MHRIGLIGCGGIAVRHLEGYRRRLAERGDVVAVCDTNPQAAERLAAKYGVARWGTTPAELFAAEVDVISVLTPAAVRDEIIFPALDHGVHLLVEKPFAHDVESASRYVEAAEAAGVQLAVNQQMRFMPEAQTTKSVIDQGALGDLVHLSHEVHQRRIAVRGWRKDESRLEISIYSIHILDRLRWWAGRRATTVSAVTRHLNPETRGETYTALTMQFEGGAVAVMVSNWHALCLTEARLRLDGTAGTLVGRSDNVVCDSGELRLQQEGGEPRNLDWHREANFSEAFGDSMAHLLDAIEQGQPPVHSGRDNLQTMAIVDAAYRSASRGGEATETWGR